MEVGGRSPEPPDAVKTITWVLSLTRLLRRDFRELVTGRVWRRRDNGLEVALSGALTMGSRSPGAVGELVRAKATCVVGAGGERPASA